MVRQNETEITNEPRIGYYDSVPIIATSKDIGTK